MSLYSHDGQLSNRCPRCAHPADGLEVLPLNIATTDQVLQDIHAVTVSGTQRENRFIDDMMGSPETTMT